MKSHETHTHTTLKFNLFDDFVYCVINFRNFRKYIPPHIYGAYKQIHQNGLNGDIFLALIQDISLKAFFLVFFFNCVILYAPFSLKSHIMRRWETKKHTNTTIAFNFQLTKSQHNNLKKDEKQLLNYLLLSKVHKKASRIK